MTERVGLCRVSIACKHWRCGRASGVIQNDNSIKDNRSLSIGRFYIFTVCFVWLFFELQAKSKFVVL